MIVGAFGLTLGGSWVVFTAMDIDAATSMLAGTWFTLHGGYALMQSGGERATDMPEPARSRAPRPMPGHFNVAVNPDPRSPHATFSMTF